MSVRPPFPEDQIDGLVRGYLEAEARDVDLAKNLAAIAQRQRETLDGDVAQPVRRGGWLSSHRRIAWRIGVAACLVVAVGLTSYFALSPESANAYALVRDADSALATPADRCYRVESQVPKVWLRNNPLLDDGEETRVWTRGDQFHVQTTRQGRQYNWGQDAQQRLWVVCDPHLGVRFDRQEVPPALARTRTYLGLDIRRLTKRFLSDFDLHIDKVSSNAHEGGPRRLAIVLATAKPGRPGFPFNTARLEVELQTKVIRSMELARVVDGQVKGQVTFRLMDEPNQAPSYDLESQLQAGAKVLAADQSSERSAALRQLFESR